MKIETDDVKTTKEAAEHVGMKPGELTGFVTKHGIEVPRLGRTYLWTRDVLDTVTMYGLRIAAGLCVHCEKPWNRPSRLDATPPAPEPSE